jgi:hypothetical protein
MHHDDKLIANKQLVEAIDTELARDPRLPSSAPDKSLTVAILETAIANDVFYPAYKWLSNDGGPDSFPDNMSAQKYEQLFYQYLVSQTIQQSEAALLLSSFEEKGLEVMPLKGLFLSTQYYKDPLMRYSRDWDFLFESETDRFFAEQALVKAGYHVSESRPLQTLFTRHISRFSAHCETHSIPISLTYSFEYPPWYDLWPGSRSGQVMGYPARLMRPEDAFLVLCAHVLTNGILSMRDLMDFMVIMGRFNSLSWSQLKQLSEAPIWRYIIAVPLALFSTIAQIFLSRELVPREIIQFFAAHTTIRIEESRKLVCFLLREYGTPIDLRHVMRYFGYSETPLLAVYLVWNEGRELTFFARIKKVFLEGCQSLALARSESSQGYAKNCIQSYLSTYVLYFGRHRTLAA